MKINYALTFFILLLSSTVFSQEILLGDTDYVEACSGFFYDNGGAGGGAGAYSDNNGENQIITICSGTDQRVQLEFTSFILASGAAADYLIIYDGDNVNAPVLGEFTSFNSPGIIAASGNNSSGCLTFEFVLDGITSPLPGWEAEISCLDPCTQESLLIQDVTPSSYSNGSYQVYSGQELEFTSDSSLDPANGTISYEWNFGNGTEVGSTASNIYNLPGTYTVTLTATQNDCEYSTSVNLVVEDINEFSLYTQFNGKYESIAIGNTLNTGPNGLNLNCTPLSSNSATLNLEPGQTVEAAYLYWAGSGAGDFEVELNGEQIVSERNFNVTIITNGSYPIFGAFADVTDIVSSTGNGEYTFSDIDLEAGFTSHCGNGLNFGGWSIVVVYEDLTLNNNQVGIYDGFQFVSSNSGNLDITLSGFEVIDTQDATVAFLAWEGDAGTNLGEELNFNGTELTNAINPSGNAFNSTNSYTGDTNLYCMDLDFFDISSYINIGDTEALVNLQTAQDAVIVHNIVLNINSELPDATIEIIDVIGDEICGNDELEIEFTVFNTNSTKELPANTLVSFYANGEFLLSTTTNNPIPIGESETQVITIPILDNLPDDNNPSDFVLTAIVDENNEVDESNNDNNEFYQDIFLTNTIEVPELTALESCSDLNGISVIDLTQIEEEIPSQYNVNYYPSDVDAQNNTNEITSPEAYETSNSEETLVALISLENCSEIVNFDIQTFTTPQIENIEDITECEINGGGANFDLTQNTSLALGNQDETQFAVSYYENEAEANSGVNQIINTSDYPALSNPQEIFIRIENINHPECYSVSSFNISAANVYIGEVENLYECSENASGITSFDLTQNSANALSDQDPDNFVVEYYASAEDLDTNQLIDNPEDYQSLNNPQTIYVKVRNINNDSCEEVSNFEIRGFYNGSQFNDPQDLFSCNNGINDPSVNLEENTEHILRLETYFLNLLNEQNIFYSINGKKRIPGVFNITFHGVIGQDLVLQLDFSGIG
uniref:PKD domain-containing protein n=1 Tax=Mesonia mobilis TaxID=369791 RepID=UPI0026F34865